MFVHDRHRAILQRLRKKPRWSVDDLLRELPISRSTLRRDLLELERLRSVVRVHGGAMHPDYLRGEPTFDRRGRERAGEKQAIAAAAVTLIPDNSTVYLDAGTTAMEVGRLLLPRTNLKLFTHSIRLMALAGEGCASITCIGGEYRAASDAVVGGLNLNWLEHLRFDVAVIGASGLSTTAASTTELSECAVKQAIISRAERRILVCDSGKWNHPAAVQFARWREFQVWVTDENLPRAARTHCRGFGAPLEVVIAPCESGVVK